MSQVEGWNGADSGWAEVPELRLAGKRAPSRPAQELLAIILTSVGPVIRIVVLGFDGLAVTVATTVAASLLVGLAGARRWWLRLALVAASGAVLYQAQGDVVAAWVSALLLLCDWVIRRRRPLPFVPAASSNATGPLVVFVGLATWRGARSPDPFGIALFIGMAFVVTAVGTWFGSRFDRIVAAIGHAAARVVGNVCFFALGVFVVGIPSLAHRLLRVDPLSWPTSPATAWVRRTNPPMSPQEPWSVEPAVPRFGAATKVRRALVAPLALLITGSVVALAFALWPFQGSEGRSNSDDGWNVEQRWPAHDGDLWYDDYRQAESWALNARPPWYPLRAFRVADIESDYINVANGVRRSWGPPECDCVRIVVWLYGGSTTFGLGQRDDHTIASELARVAWDHGIALDVSNRGMPGHMHWSEANRFAWDVTVEDAPDLVLFYDGVNELWGVQTLQTEQDLLQPLEPLTEDIWEGVKDTNVPRTDRPDGASVLEPTELPNRTPEEMGELAAQLYDRSRGISADVADANGVPIYWFWQPSRMSRPQRDDEPTSESYGGEERRLLYEGAESSVPDGVIDLTEVFDEVDAPLFSDEVHHNELGATIVAEAMFDAIEPELQVLRRGDGDHP